MFLSIKNKKDTYITNKYISGISKVSSSVGIAGTLDLFKLYGETLIQSSSQPLTEISRGLIYFDLSELNDLVNSNKIDVNDDSFKAFLSLKDAYGGQTTPENFTIVASPLSSSFEEGRGKDVVYYADIDSANFMSSSRGISWISEGCSSQGAVGDICDFFITSSFGCTTASQKFDGPEDMMMDITNIVSATVGGLIENNGLRLSFSSTEEQDQKSYFVKRFSTRHAQDSSKHPRLIIKFNDAIRDDSLGLTFGDDMTLSFMNVRNGVVDNILSGSSLLTGSNCLTMNLIHSSSLVYFSQSYNASQFSRGNFSLPGVYYATVNIPMTQDFSQIISSSGSVTFTQTWVSNDGLTIYGIPKRIKFYNSQNISQNFGSKYTISISGIPDIINHNEDVYCRINIFDPLSPQINLTKTPLVTPNKYSNSCLYSVRNIVTNEIMIPFDEEYQSTQTSQDAVGRYFTLKTSSLEKNQSYVIDLKVRYDGHLVTHEGVSNIFTVR